MKRGYKSRQRGYKSRQRGYKSPPPLFIKRGTFGVSKEHKQTEKETKIYTREKRKNMHPPLIKGGPRRDLYTSTRQISPSSYKSTPPSFINEGTPCVSKEHRRSARGHIYILQQNLLKYIDAFLYRCYAKNSCVISATNRKENRDRVF